MPKYLIADMKSKWMNESNSSDSSFPHSQCIEEKLISAFIYLSIVFRKGLMQPDHFHQRSLVFTGIKVIFTAEPIQDFLCCIQLAFHVRKQLVFLFFGHFSWCFGLALFVSHNLTQIDKRGVRQFASRQRGSGKPLQQDNEKLTPIGASLIVLFPL